MTLASTAPGRTWGIVTRAAVSSRNDPRNTARSMPAAAAVPSTLGIAGVIAPALASPTVAVAATVITPSEPSTSSPRSLD